MKVLWYVFTLGVFLSCNNEDDSSSITIPTVTQDSIEFLSGGDLSYVNEMEDCGAVYKNVDGQNEDPYKVFADAGMDIVRLRLWHSPDWTNYSNFEDVKKSIQR